MSDEVLSLSDVVMLDKVHFELDGDDCIIKKRVKGLQVKPPLYIWDLSKACYVSSLKYVGKGQGVIEFVFDVVRKGKDKLMMCGVYDCKTGQFCAKQKN